METIFDIMSKKSAKPTQAGADGTDGITIPHTVVEMDMGDAPSADDGTPAEELTGTPAWLGSQGLGVTEDDIVSWCPALLDVLLADRSSGHNAIWATDGKSIHGVEHTADQEITPDQVTGEMRGTIRPRVAKARALQASRTKEKAEVFTPSWICNMMNNVVDRAWFGGDWDDKSAGSPFNDETDKGWVATSGDIAFPDLPSDGDKDAKSWQAYVRANRMEMACGEAPYLVSRYDTTTGDPIALPDRIGLLDRKLRVVQENTWDDDEAWREWALVALRSCYGFEYQGDSLLIARENMLLGWADAYKARLGHAPSADECMEVADIVSWNVWQMDAFTMCIPGTDTKSLVMNWDAGQPFEFEKQVKHD